MPHLVFLDLPTLLSLAADAAETPDLVLSHTSDLPDAAALNTALAAAAHLVHAVAPCRTGGVAGARWLRVLDEEGAILALMPYRPRGSRGRYFPHAVLRLAADAGFTRLSIDPTDGSLAVAPPPDPPGQRASVPPT